MDGRPAAFELRAFLFDQDLRSWSSMALGGANPTLSVSAEIELKHKLVGSKGVEAGEDRGVACGMAICGTRRRKGTAAERGRTTGFPVSGDDVAQLGYGIGGEGI